MDNKKVVETQVYANEKNTTINVTEIKDTTASLNRTTSHLNLLSHTVIILTILHIIIAFLVSTDLFLTLARALNFNDSVISIVVPLFSALLLLVLVITISQFDINRRMGHALFEELSDELHSIKIHEKALKKANFSFREMRIAIRYFTSSDTLPLVPSQYGSAILSIINIILFILITQNFIIWPKI